MNSLRKEIPISDELRNELVRKSSLFTAVKNCLSTLHKEVFSMGVVLSIIVVCIWLLLNWLIGFVIEFDFGWGSEYRNIIFFGIILASFFLIACEIIRCQIPKKEFRNKVKQDLLAGVIEVIEYEIKSLKVFEEPEHGGFIYFLLTTDDEVLVMYDSESQDLSIDDQDPMSSSFLPRRVLKISKTIHSSIAVDEEFSGDLIEFPELEVMTAKTSIWPEHGKILRCKWDKIESKYAS